MIWNWIRTCQECGYKQDCKPPFKYKGDGWQETKCKKCKSPALDYGSEDLDEPNLTEW